MKHDVLTHNTFFEHMDEFGYLRDLEAVLPEDFTSVFEIARVLEDQDSPLFKTLSPALTVAVNNVKQQKRPDRGWKPNFNVANGAEYEVELLRSVSDIKRILPHQFLLPDNVFTRRLATRSLMMHVPKTPVILGFDHAGTEFSPNNFKQKVYVLLDTSASMTSHHRFQMAKAVVYVFLKRNLRELGHVYLRTFDVDVGPLQVATDPGGLKRLIHYTMRLNRLGNGTVMEKALLLAAEDIRAKSALSGAEVLMVTDGACHLNMDVIREALGDTIRVNAIKIGEAKIFPDEKLLRQTASQGKSPQQVELAHLEEDIRRCKLDMDRVSAESEKRRLRSQLAGMESRAEQIRTAVVDRISKQYGREIEYLSRVFVNVDDISADAIFTLQQSQVDEIRELMREVEADFEDGADADSFREAALLFEHVQMLLNNASDQEQIRQLEQIADRLNELLKQLDDSGGNHTREPARSGQTKGMARADIHDIHMMLRQKPPKGAGGISLFRLAMRVVRMVARRIRRVTPGKRL